MTGSTRTTLSRRAEGFYQPFSMFTHRKLYLFVESPKVSVDHFVKRYFTRPLSRTRYSHIWAGNGSRIPCVVIYLQSVYMS